MSLQQIRWIKECAKVALAPLARVATKRFARVLMYHRFGPGDPGRRLDAEALDRQLRFLRRHFNVIPHRELVSRLRSGSAIEPRTVVLTVDDAYADFGEHAYPLFRKYGMPVTVFVVSEFASGSFWLWWDAIRYLLNQAANGPYRLMAPGDEQIDITLTDRSSRFEAWLRMAGIGLTVTPTERDQYICGLPSVLSVSMPAAPPREFAALGWDELKALDPDIVEIGAHTRTHPILSRCDSTRIADEVVGSKMAIEAQIGRRVSTFCYPNGGWADVDERCRSAVRDAGFDSAVMACGDMVRQEANLYALERMSVAHRTSDFEADVSGIGYMLRRASRKGVPSLS